MEQDERLLMETSLLESMYPDQITWMRNRREVKYIAENRALHLRLPEGYLLDQLPEVLSASVDRSDVREQLKQHIQTCNLGEEVLDSIIFAFTELPASSKSETTDAASSETSSKVNARHSSKATVIVWLHHLLNTNKRKQALSPASSAVSGVTKPGYPGVLVYSGAADAVREHVDELKQLNWQAFQVRYESDEEWTFAHGAGVKEVEAMKDVVAEIGDGRRQQFMEAMRMK